MISTSGLNYYPSLGDQFSYWLQATGGADDVNLSYGVQDHQNRYFVRVDFANDNLKLYRYESGTSYLLAKNTSGFTLAEDAWYEIEIKWDDDGTQTATIFDVHGGQVAATSATDLTWSDGGVGYDAYLGSGGTVYVDLITVRRYLVDGFEDSDLSEYSFDRGSSGASIVSSPTNNGSNALEISGTNTEMISTSGLNYYPSLGDQFSYWVRATGGADDVNLSYGVQDHQNRYLVRVDFADDKLALWRYEGGKSYVLASETTGETIVEDAWYEVSVEWKDDGNHTVKLYDSGHTLIGRITGTDSTWISGGIGYDAYLGSGGTVYFDYVTIGRCRSCGCSTYTTIDSFEDGDLSEYSFDRGSSGASIVSSPTYDGSNALEISGTNTEMISTSGLPQYPSIDDTFGYWVRATGGADDVNLSYGVQDRQNRYFVRVDFANGNLKLYRYEGGTSYLLAEQTSGFSLKEDAWYLARVEWTEAGGHAVRLFDSNGIQVSYISGTDSTWTSGGIGYDAYLGSGGSVYFDFVTVTGGRQNTIDSFEDSDLSEYSFDRGSSGASIVSSPTNNGSNALEISGTNTEMISTSGLNYYPSLGDQFSYWVRATGGADDVNLSYGVQDHQNRYFVRVDFANDNLKLYRYESGTSYLLAKQTSGFSLEEDTWFEVEVSWSNGGIQTVALYDPSGTKRADVSATDSTWTSGGIGYDAYLGSGGTVYFDNVTVSSASDLPNEVTVTGSTGDGSNANYELTVSGAVAKGELADGGDSAADGTASGGVADGGQDSFVFSGEITRFTVPNHLQLEVDRQNGSITVTDLRSSPSTAADYEFTVSGSLTALSSVESSDSVSSGTATGSVTGDKDTYEFTGDLKVVRFLNEIKADIRTEYPHVVNNPHPNATVNELSIEAVKDPYHDRAVFTSNALSGNGSYELYMAHGVTSLNDVPSRITELSRSTLVGTFDLNWVKENQLQYWHDGSESRQELKPKNVVKKPVERIEKSRPGVPCKQNGGGA